MGHIASAARDEGPEPVLVFLGLTYAPESSAPNFFFDTPVTDFPRDIHAITELVERRRRKALTRAAGTQISGKARRLMS
ncbi:hypothetical protein ACFXNW_06215 [Nocardia sp. NPDC059180]|uniref:hypothetical protein n=1 Tax=Nocardia sp. NPDC059180 TaxID=3346761 RepID=UPI003695E04A